MGDEERGRAFIRGGGGGGGGGGHISGTFIMVIQESAILTVILYVAIGSAVKVLHHYLQVHANILEICAATCIWQYLATIH